MDAFPKAQAAVLKALELDDSLADSHASLGFIKFWFDWDWEGAEIHCKRAVDLNPNSRDAHRAYALLHFHLGRYAEAVKEIRRAKELDPLSLLDNSLEGMILHYAGRDDEALTNFKKVLEVDSFWIARVQLAKVYTRKRMYAVHWPAMLGRCPASGRGHMRQGSVVLKVTVIGYFLTTTYWGIDQETSGASGGGIWVMVRENGRLLVPGPSTQRRNHGSCSTPGQLRAS